VIENKETSPKTFISLILDKDSIVEHTIKPGEFILNVKGNLLGFDFHFGPGPAFYSEENSSLH